MGFEDVIPEPIDVRCFGEQPAVVQSVHISDDGLPAAPHQESSQGLPTSAAVNVREAVPQTMLIRRCDGLHEPLHRSRTMGTSAVEGSPEVEVIWLQTVNITVGSSPCPDLSRPQFCKGYPCMHNAWHWIHCWCKLRGFCSPRTTRGNHQTQLCSPHKAQAPGEQPDKLRVPPGSMLAPAVRVVNQLHHGREHVAPQGPLM